MLETNIDDMNGEIYSYILPLLFQQGALDVFYTPIIMKKNRPGIKLSVLCTDDYMPQLEEVIFRETTTLGIRKYVVDRHILERRYENIKTPYGNIQLKLGILDNEIIKVAPEYEDCMGVAIEHQVPLKEVYQLVSTLYNKEYPE